MWWPWSKASAYNAAEIETRSAQWSVSDPAVAELFGLGGELGPVSEDKALGLSAVYRAVSLIAGTIASLPMRTLAASRDGHTERTGSFLDTPAGPGPDAPTRFEWIETVLVHLLLHGNAYLAHLYGGAGQIVGLQPIHPLAVAVDRDDYGFKTFTVSLHDGMRRVFRSQQMTHIPALSTDGMVGLSPITVARNSLGTSLAGEQAAARQFRNGAMVSGMVTPLEDLTADEAATIKTDLRNRLQGINNAGDIAVINRKLKFDQWSMNAEDAQFLQSRAFQVEEVARWFGLQPMHLGQTDKQTSWGTGVQEQNRGLARYVLEPWTTRIQERLTRLLTGNKKVEFDYTAFVQPSPEIEIPLLIQQVDAGLLTVNEARKIRNMGPLPGGDEITTDEADSEPSEPARPELRIASAAPPALAQFGQPLTLPIPGTPTTNGHTHADH